MDDYRPTGDFRPDEPNVAYIGEGVSFKGSISVPDAVVIDGVVEGDVTARTIKVGPSGSIKGSITSTDADVHGVVMERIEVKQLLIVRSTGRVEGTVTYGEVQVEKGAIISGGFESTESRSERTAAGPKELRLERLKLTFNGSGDHHQDDEAEQVGVRRMAN